MKPQRTHERFSRPTTDERARAVADALAEHGRWLRTVLAARGVERDALDEVLQEVAAEALRGAAQLARRRASWRRGCTGSR